MSRSFHNSSLIAQRGISAEGKDPSSSSRKPQQVRSMQRAYLDNSEWESTETPKAKRLTMEAPLIPHPTPQLALECAASRWLIPPDSVSLEWGETVEHWENTSSKCEVTVGLGTRTVTEQQHWCLKHCTSFSMLVGGGLVHRGGEQRPHVLKANSPMWWGSFLCGVPFFSLQRIKRVVFHCDTGKGLYAQQFGASRLSHLGIGLGINAPCVRLITCGCGDTACQGWCGGCRFVGKAEV